jgi:hypothetical protein
MIYKGKEIKDHEEVLVEEDPFIEYGDNFVEFTLEDLEDLARDYKEKEQSLKEEGIDFCDLKMNFHGTSYYCNPNGPDEDSNMEIYFSYYRPETEEEHDERILRKMQWIDHEIENEEREKNASELVKRVEIEKAKKLLEENGYSVK